MSAEHSYTVKTVDSFESHPSRYRHWILEVDGDDVDAIIQAGTNLAMARLAATAERWLKKPVIAINTATYWHALRTCGFDDKVQGFGTLLTDH